MKIQCELGLVESDTKIRLIKGFRTILGLGLKEAKDFVEANFCKWVEDNQHFGGGVCTLRTGESFTIILSAEQFCRYTLDASLDGFWLNGAHIVELPSTIFDLSSVGK